MDDLSRFGCQNSECPDYGKRGGENLSVCDHYGPNKQRRMLRCSTCKTRFCERKGTPGTSTRNWWLFPPQTREVQFDEKWSFVGKKEKHCDPDDPDDAKQGDNWDHVALDPEHRLVVSNKINTAFVERQNGTDRNRNGRKVRKTYCFSKDWDVHGAVTYFTMYTYNFCWPVRTLRIRGPDDHWQQRSPAMAAGLTDHLWSLREWLTFPAVQRE